jgi:hypothetical protein
MGKHLFAVQISINNKSYSCNRSWRPIVLWDVEDPCLDNRLTDSDEVVSLSHQLRSSPQIIFYFPIWYSFLLEAELTQGAMLPEGLDKLIDISYLIGSRTRDFSSCSLLCEPLR